MPWYIDFIQAAIGSRENKGVANMTVGTVVAKLTKGGQYLDRVYGFCAGCPEHATPLTMQQAIGLVIIFGSDIKLIMWHGQEIGWEDVGCFSMP